jgi:hypothetical protein
MGEIAINPIHNVHKKYRTMNLVNSYIFTPPVTYNTYIGGISASVSSASLLATKLGISVGAISNFTVVGSDIKCKITGSYSPPSSAFINNANVTSYVDKDGLIIGLGNSCFDFEIVNSQFILFYAPNLITCGTTSGNNLVFRNVNRNLNIYVNSAISTDSDITSVISEGAIVNFVTNYTAPNPVTTLAAGTVYNTAIQLNFTAPSTTNAIDYYEVYVDGIFKNNIDSSGAYVYGLTASTSYNITVVAVDIFYNKSLVSNTLSTSTNTTAYPYEYLMAYYKLNANSRDNYKKVPSNPINMTYAAGKINNSGVFNGSTSIIKNNIFIPYGSFTISAWIKTSSTADNVIFSNRKFGVSNPIILMMVSGGKLFTRIRSTAGTGLTSFSSTSSVNTGTWRHVAMRFDIATGLQSNFVDGVFNNSTTYSGGTFDFNLSTIGVEQGYGYFNGNIDGLAVFSSALTNAEMTNVYNIQNAGNDLIP